MPCRMMLGKWSVTPQPTVLCVFLSENFHAIGVPKIVLKLSSIMNCFWYCKFSGDCRLHIMWQSSAPNCKWPKVFGGGFTGAPPFLQCEWTHKPTKQFHGAVLPKKLILPELVKNFPVFDDTRRFVTRFTRVNYLFLSWGISIRFMPCNPISWRFHLVLSSHLCQDPVPFYRWQL